MNGNRQEECEEADWERGQWPKQYHEKQDDLNQPRVAMYVHTHTYAHTDTHKNTWNPGRCVFAQQHSLFQFRPISFHLIPAQEPVIRNVHTLLRIQNLICAEEIGKKRRKEESVERREGQ